MNITREELALLQSRTHQGPQLPVHEGWKDGALTIFVPGKPTHYKGKGHRYAVSQHTKEWRERTASRLLMHCSGWAHPELRFIVAGGFKSPWPWTPTARKLVIFTVYCRNAFDGDDNLRLVCSPLKDALGPTGARKPGVGLLDDDRDSSGHTFLYTQVVARKVGSVHGIAVRVALA